MVFRTTALVIAALVVSICLDNPMRAETQWRPGVFVRVQFLKSSSFEPVARGGPVLIGPQSALELEWQLSNSSNETYEIPAPHEAVRLRVVQNGREISVTTLWSADMTLRVTRGGHLDAAAVPARAIALPDNSTLWIRGSTTRVDGSVFTPGNYVLELDVGGLERALIATHPAPRVDPGFPISVHIAPLNSPARERQFHLLEGNFYDDTDVERALVHYLALAALPKAPWSDSLPLAQLYGSLGRHRDAIDVYRRILPDLIQGLDFPFGRELIRQTGHLRRAAMSFAAEGDIATASELLRREGLTREEEIQAMIEQLRQRAWKSRGQARK